MDKIHIKQSNSFFLTKIFRRIFLSFSLSITILILLYSYATTSFEKNTQVEVLRSKTQTLANSIVLANKNAMLKDDMSSIVEYCIAVLSKNKDILKIEVTNYQNENISVNHKGWRMFNSLDENLSKMQKSNDFFKMYYCKKLKQTIFHYSYPVRLPGMNWGYIHIYYSLNSYSLAVDNLYKSIAILLGLIFLATLIISYFISRNIALPIIKLSKSAELVEAGNLQTRVNIKQKDEIGEFAKNFNGMIEKLEDSHENLEKQVMQRTKELEELNYVLDEKIKIAIKENTQKEQMLIQQSRLAAMGEMIGNIAHQWRQPLNALSLVLQNIYYSYESGDLDKEYLEHSMEKGKKLTQNMSKTIDDFRDFFRPNKRKETFNISESISNVYELISASYKNHHIIIESEIDETLESFGYPNEFAQVLLNVLTNAKDALIGKKVESPLVKVRVFSKNEFIILEIEDNAGGIDESIIDKIFDPYFTTKDKNAGTGIGLYMSKMIIENNMNGKIYAQNGQLGAIMVVRIFKKEKDNA